MDNVNSTWGSRFIISAIAQGGIITFLSLSMVGIQMIFAKDVNMIQFLSLSFEGPAKWFFIGLMLYLIITVAIAVTAVFYNHLEVNMRKKITGKTNLLVWIHLIGMNIGGLGTTLSMIFAGLIGSGAMDILNTGQIGKANLAVMDSFIPPIATFIGILAIGVLCGGLAYAVSYLKKSPVLD
ncbi:MAG: hypothetical protein EB163_02085 [Nitrososphaeria archaeon]|nr:hypothetical protein [Nitrososphaeria archaeon]NDB50700.1 hypothetical protein [Nitrosopumilaceae archaeon]NDB88735.1 hypothetical protein [Nitrososphaerota archaeon]NDB62998.1 hypothetical protein [Nitrosopumilaceae archaeon]NDB92587.1 hypothetical protein [Nitrososphaeria archaeon]